MTSMTQMSHNDSKYTAFLEASKFLSQGVMKLSLDTHGGKGASYCHYDFDDTINES